VPDTDFVLLLPAFLPIGATHLLRLVPGTFCLYGLVWGGWGAWGLRVVGEVWVWVAIGGLWVRGDWGFCGVLESEIGATHLLSLVPGTFCC
jgi:hypothetical protein